MTASQARQIVTKLSRDPLPSPGRIAGEIAQVLRRDQESKIDHFHAKTGAFPPRRTQPDPG